MRILYIYIIMCFFISCSISTSKRDFSILPISLANTKISDIELDTIFLDSVPTSYVVESNIHLGKIYLLDKLFCMLYQFDNEGKLQGRYLGQGRAKNE
ncbi:MAG: hypothetical protein IJ340_10245, partial [Odoribacter sp.]|nr:hypothetical protein [Odoribacter sp.]